MNTLAASANTVYNKLNPDWKNPANGNRVYFDLGQGSGDIVLGTSGGNALRITGLGSNLLPYGDLSQSLGSSTSRWLGLFNAYHYKTIQTLISGTTPAVNALSGDHCFLNIASNIAVVIQPPTNPPVAGHKQLLSFEIKNGSGGALTTQPTFSTAAGGYKVTGSLPAITNGQRYTIVFEYSQDAGFWIQVSITPFAY